MFIAPCVVTTNDNFMGRTEKRKELMKRADDPPRRPHRRRRDSLPRRRDRRGGVRRRRRGRDEGRRRRASLVVGSPARVLRDVDAGRAQGERRLTREREVVLHGLARPRDQLRREVVDAAARATRYESRAWRPTWCESASRSDVSHVEAVDVLACPAPTAAAAPSRRSPGVSRANSRWPALSRTR